MGILFLLLVIVAAGFCVYAFVSHCFYIPWELRNPHLALCLLLTRVFAVFSFSGVPRCWQVRAMG